MSQVCGFEKMIKDSGIILVKIYMSISKKEQNKRFKEIKSDPLKQWKMTEVDKKAQELWNDYTSYKDKMFFNWLESNELVCVLIVISIVQALYTYYMWQKNELLK